MLEITEYWNRVVNDPSSPFGTKVLKDEYEIKSQFRVNNNLKNLKKRWKGNKKMEMHKDYIKEDCGKAYGIHLYRIIKEVAVNEMLFM